MKDPFEAYRNHKNFHKILTLRLRFAFLSCGKEQGRLLVKRYISLMFLQVYEGWRKKSGDVRLLSQDMIYFNYVYKWVNERIDYRNDRTEWKIEDLVHYSKQDIEKAKQEDKCGQHNIQYIAIGQLNRIK